MIEAPVLVYVISSRPRCSASVSRSGVDARSSGAKGFERFDSNELECDERCEGGMGATFSEPLSVDSSLGGGLADVCRSRAPSFQGPGIFPFISRADDNQWYCRNNTNAIERSPQKADDQASLFRCH